MLEDLTISVLTDSPLTYTQEEIVYLTGIAGVHPELQKEDNIKIEIYPYVDCIRVFLTSSAIKRLQIIIYPGNKYIDNQNIRSTKSITGIGSRWVYAQAREAERQAFKYLQAIAYKDDSGSTEIWSGYIVWGKLGYLLYEDSIQDFERLMLRFGRSEKTLEELIKYPEGLTFWIKEGFPWKAWFDLTKESESKRILNEYIQKKTAAF
jgi:hypothetical protein